MVHSGGRGFLYSRNNETTEEKKTVNLITWLPFCCLASIFSVFCPLNPGPLLNLGSRSSASSSDRPPWGRSTEGPSPECPKLAGVASTHTPQPQEWFAQIYRSQSPPVMVTRLANVGEPGNTGPAGAAPGSPHLPHLPPSPAVATMVLGGSTVMGMTHEGERILGALSLRGLGAVTLACPYLL